MSGSSLDGLDVAACEFQHDDEGWRFRIDYAETFGYDAEMKDRLQNAVNIPKEELSQLDRDLAQWMGVNVKQFLTSHNYHPEFISSHGHTVFHQPEQGFTLQIGDGQVLSDQTGLPVINDFRSPDVQKGGQGAPLVPVGDELLFGKYDFCLNLGGIANISTKNLKRLAYDICPANMALNFLAGKKGLEYDENGLLAESGQLNQLLLDQLNELDYYSQPWPKSLGVEWFNEYFSPLLEASTLPVEDLLHTCAEHIAFQIASHIQRHDNYQESSTLLITGGGAFNNFLIEKIEELCRMQTVIPNERIINYKEALIFAFLGVLKVRGEINCLSSVTGASEDSSSGTIFGEIGIK